MGTKISSPGFQKITRRDKIFQKHNHDFYKIKGKLVEPAVCSRCGATYHQGRWQWRLAPAEARQVICPACHRIQDHYPAGFLTLQGDFFVANRDEIMHLVHNTEEREREAHPLKRIMAIDEKDDTALITTTDIHLVRGLGEAIYRAYQGELEFHYNQDENLLRVSWMR